MILSLAGDGPLGRALHAKLAKAGTELRLAMPTDDDLFACHAVRTGQRETCSPAARTRASGERPSNSGTPEGFRGV
jgi:hypothetical protein